MIKPQVSFCNYANICQLHFCQNVLIELIFPVCRLLVVQQTKKYKRGNVFDKNVNWTINSVMSGPRRRPERKKCGSLPPTWYRVPLTWSGIVKGHQISVRSLVFSSGGAAPPNLPTFGLFCGAARAAQEWTVSTTNQSFLYSPLHIFIHIQFLIIII